MGSDSYRKWEYDMEILHWYRDNRRPGWTEVGRHFSIPGYQVKESVKRASKYANLEDRARWTQDWTPVDEYYDEVYR